MTNQDVDHQFTIVSRFQAGFYLSPPDDTDMRSKIEIPLSARSETVAMTKYRKARRRHRRRFAVAA